MLPDRIDPKLLEFLRDPASYPHRPREVREIHTHASVVFLVPPFVYKIKKPVDLGFLDYSRLELRQRFCEREVMLNARLCSGVYLGTERITREGQGFAFNGEGRLFECAVRMKFLAPDGFLDVRLRSGLAGSAELDLVARVLARFYQNQPPVPEGAAWGGVDQLRISTEENFSQTLPFVGTMLSAGAFEAIRRFAEDCHRLRCARFDERVAGGWIRDCHGDLRLEHIHFSNGEPRIFDCIEFNDRFRLLDVASDTAFLAMDLDFHGHPGLARRFVHQVAERLHDVRMLDLMDYYQCYRAMVRGKVEAFHAREESEGDDERASARERATGYFQLALRYAVMGTSPKILAIMGRVASGKSTFAGSLGGELGLQVSSSDLRRKQLAGIPALQRGDQVERRRLYSEEMTELTYMSLLEDARQSLASDRGLVLDATFSNRAMRERFRTALGDENLIWLQVSAPRRVVIDRLLDREERAGVISDARIADLEITDAAFEEPHEIPWKSLVSTEAGHKAVVRKWLVDAASRNAADSKPQSGERLAGDFEDSD